MKNDNGNRTASQILEAYSYDLSAKINLFKNHYGFIPVKDGIDYEVLSTAQQRLSDAFFRNEQIVYLVDRIADWSEQCYMLRVWGHHAG